jgi:hypothetical protein
MAVTLKITDARPVDPAKRIKLLTAPVAPHVRLNWEQNNQTIFRAGQPLKMFLQGFSNGSLKVNGTTSFALKITGEVGDITTSSDGDRQLTDDADEGEVTLFEGDVVLPPNGDITYQPVEYYGAPEATVAGPTLPASWTPGRRVSVRIYRNGQLFPNEGRIAVVQ